MRCFTTTRADRVLRHYQMHLHVRVSSQMRKCSSGLCFAAYDKSRHGAVFLSACGALQSTISSRCCTLSQLPGPPSIFGIADMSVHTVMLLTARGVSRSSCKMASENFPTSTNSFDIYLMPCTQLSSAPNPVAGAGTFGSTVWRRPNPSTKQLFARLRAQWSLHLQAELEAGSGRNGIACRYAFLAPTA